MTRKDIACWFCRIVGMVGVFGSVLNLSSFLVFLLLRTGSSSLPYGLFSLLVSIVVWVFADGIGISLVGGGLYDDPIASKNDLLGLTLRCAGFWLCVQGTISFSSNLLIVLYMQFQATTPPFPLWRFYGSNIVIATLEACIGFFLAFGPRLLTFLRSP